MDKSDTHHQHNTIVLRNSDYEITFADVSCVTEKVMTDAELRDAVSQAVLNWREKTEEGKEAWRLSGEDFNIGDLVDYVQYAIEPNLKDELEAVGVHDLNIEIHSLEARMPTAWSYDDMLGE